MDVLIPELDGPLTPDRYWNSGETIMFRDSGCPCHPGTTSKQNYDSLEDGYKTALREYEWMEVAAEVPRGRKQLAIENYQRMNEQKLHVRNGLLYKALCTRLDSDWKTAILESGGNGNSILSLYGVREVPRVRDGKKYLEDIYPNAYPVSKQRERVGSTKPFIPDNYRINEGKLLVLEYPAIPFEAIASDLSLEDILNFDTCYGEDGTIEVVLGGAMTDSEEDSDSSGESKKDSPMRELSNAHFKSEERGEEGQLQMGN